MRTVFIDANPLCQQTTGFQRMIYETLRSLDALLVENESDLEVHMCYPKGLHATLPVFAKIKVDEVSSPRWLPWPLVSLPFFVWRHHGLLCRMATGLCLYKPSILAIHDMRPQKFKEYDVFRVRVNTIISNYVAKILSHQLVTVSYTIKKEIEDILHIPPERIQVIYNGWQHMQRIPEDESVWETYPQLKKGHYYFALGSVARHKNYEWLLAVAQKHPDDIFAVSGMLNTRKLPVGIQLQAAPSNVVYVGYVSDAQCKTLMKHCKAFLQPSKYEGFGIPPLEALSVGARICVSNASCLPEIYEDCAYYFDPDDYSVDLNVLLQGTVSPPDRLLARYSWDTAANQWLRLLEQSV